LLEINQNHQIEEKIFKKIPLKPNTLKTLKVMAIEMDLDKDGKITADMFGICIDELARLYKDKDTAH